MKQKTATKERVPKPRSASMSRVSTRLAYNGRRAWKSRYLYLLLLPTLAWYAIFMYGPMYGLQIASMSRVSTRLAYNGRRAWKSRYLYLLLLPTLAWYAIFMYGPMYGLQIAFKDFMPFLGIEGSPWGGFKHFISFFQSEYFWRLIKNTLGISLYSILVGFPVPILLALLMNEVGNKYFKKGVQTIAYLPHFISAVVVVSIVNSILSPNSGLLNQLIELCGGDPVHFMAEPKYFKTVYVLSDIWQSAGYNSIVYLAALTSIDPSMYEAATVDGASKWDKLIRITLPSLLPTIMIMLILRMGTVFSVGWRR